MTHQHTTDIATWDINRINHEFTLIEQQKAALHLFQIALLNRLNDIQSIPNTIPVEILSHIMELAVTAANIYSAYSWNKQTDRYLPMKLCAVSSHWRRVALSTPRIWTSLRLVESGARQKLGDQDMLLRHYFERAKSLPLSLVFRIGGAEEDIKRILYVAFTENRSRIQSLEWYADSDELKMFNGDGDAYSQLQDLALYGSGKCLPSTAPILPVLQKLTLECISGFKISTTTITHLHLTGIPFDDCIRLLRECCETLVEIRCECVLAPQSGEDWLDNANCRVYTLPRLEVLCWSSANGNASEGDRIILYHLDLPSLRTFSIILSPENIIPDIPALQHGVKTISLNTVISTLSTVYITLCKDSTAHEWGEEDLRHLLDMHTRSLGIDPESYMGTLGIVLALTPSRHPERKVIIPELQTLIFREAVSPIDDEEGEELGSAILSMLEERLLGDETTEIRNEPFVLALPYDSMEEDYPQYERKLHDLVHAGVLQLARCGNPGIQAFWLEHDI